MPNTDLTTISPHYVRHIILTNINLKEIIIFTVYLPLQDWAL